MTALKSAAEQERQRVFDLVRHMVGNKHQVPSKLSTDDLYLVYNILWKMCNG